MDEELTQVPEEFRPACGRRGSHVIVRHFPVTIPHALCDLTDVVISYPGHGGATVPATPGGIANSLGFLLTVDPGTLDVTVEVRLRPGKPHP
ncbi:MAG: hypothetical protein ACRDOC_06690 [Streptosporangiaceae bacterium]